ncbi:nucleotidyltransferase family protein [Lacibacterium aquatile]|uniref:Nucleotidyltransferase family protein n=1 Tax=Lacibacterium aquatile TaxID=1168082 RepID=A0ABW5DZE9_9PROT
MSGITALVLAGSRQGAADPLAVAGNVSHKALLPVGGQAMILRVVTALRASGRIGRIAISIESPQALAPIIGLLGDVEILPAASGPSKSVAEALDLLGAPLLVTTADHALLQPEWVRQFLDDQPADADLAIGLAERKAILAALPNTRRTYLKFSDGAVSGCNLFYLRTLEARRAVVLWQRLEALRKQPLHMIAAFGVWPLIRFATGTLSKRAALKHIGRKTELAVGAVEMKNGLAAVDVDKLQDLELVEELFRTGRI